MRYSAVVALIGLSGSWAVAPGRRFRALASSSCLDAAREVPAGLSASLIAVPPLVARLLLSDGRAVARCWPPPRRADAPLFRQALLGDRSRLAAVSRRPLVDAASFEPSVDSSLCLDPGL